MISKVFELRAEATFMVIMATKISAENEAERFLLSRSGFGRSNDDFKKYILLQPINGGEGFCTTDAMKHGIKELTIAHQFISQYFDNLVNGAVIDIDFIEGRTENPKKSERLIYEYGTYFDIMD